MKHYHPDPDHTPDGYRTDEDPREGLENHPLWQRDNVVMTSVGIDIGSAGTQVLFSRVHLRRQGVDLSTRYLVVDRETLYESSVSLTPYAGDTLIDARRLGAIVDEAYAAAGLHPKEVDTGAVILTGEALRRENARAIARILSEKCGDLVCESAGHHMEATLAAHGSGAVALSHARGQRLLNLDVGGGTTKLGVVDKGTVVATAALQVGGRLVAVDAAGTIERLDAAGRAHAARAGYVWRVGERVSDADLEAVAQSMADDLVSALTLPELPDEVADLYLTDPIGELGPIDAVLCSGGVAEYVYGREHRGFGDLGQELGAALRSRLDSGDLPWPLLDDSHGIRSTVLGCAQFTAQLGGNTSYFSDARRLLPRRNLKVLRPSFELGDTFEPAALAAAIRDHMVSFDLDELDPRLVLAFHWEGPPRYSRLASFARGIVDALPRRLSAGQPIYVVLDADVAMNLGAILQELAGGDASIAVVDGLKLWDFDSIDIGRLREPSMTVPVTIKSLVFNDVTGGPRRRELVHHAPRATAGGRARQP